LLAYAAAGSVPVRLIPAARDVNDGMPLHMIELLEQALAEAVVPLSKARIAVLGYAYLENSDDSRNSPSEVLVRRLRELGAEVRVHDPWVREYQADVLETLRGCDAAVVMVAHEEYRDLDLRPVKTAMRAPVLVDGRNIVNGTSAAAMGFIFRAVGKGHNTPPGQAGASAWWP
jgi:UDP-N-acetyl-D-mannosaminuronic acid dehydrogenase